MKLAFKNILLALIILLADQLIKYYVLHKMSVDFVLAKFINSELNYNLALSLPSTISLAIIVNVIGIVAILYLLVYNPNQSIKKYLAIILGAGTSNLIDRLIHGGVIDYINFFNISTINLADIMIVIAIILIFISERKQIDKQQQQLL